MKFPPRIQSQNVWLGITYLLVMLTVCRAPSLHARNEPLLKLFNPEAFGLPADTTFYTDQAMLNHQGELLIPTGLYSASSPLPNRQSYSLWKRTISSLELILQSGLPPTPNADYYLYAFENAHLSDDGEIQFRASSFDLATGAYIYDSEGLWSNQNGAFELALPEQYPAGSFGLMTYFPLRDPSLTHYSHTGDVFFYTDHYTSPNDVRYSGSLWLNTSNGLTTIAKTGDPAPGLPTEYVFNDFVFHIPGRSSINGTGTVMFSAEVWENDQDPLSDRTTALWKYSDSGLEPVFEYYNALPPAMPADKRAVISQAHLSLNDSGHSIIAMPDRANFGGDDDDLHNGIWSDRTGVWENIAYTDQQAPRLPEGISFDHFGDSRQSRYVPVINANGKIAFPAFLKSSDVELVDSSNDRTIYSDITGQLQPIIRKGDDVPGFSDYQFFGIGPVSMNALDQIAFTATAKNNSDFFGFTWIVGPMGEIHPVITPGQFIDGYELQGASLANATPTGGQDGHARNFNDMGQLLYTAHYEGYIEDLDRFEEIILYTPDLHYRSTVSSSFDDRYSWTLSTQPAHVHDVFINPTASGLTVTGPSEHTMVTNLVVGSDDTPVIYQPRAKVPRVGIVLEAIETISIHEDAMLDLSLYAATEPSLDESLTLFSAAEIQGVFGGGVIGADLNSGLVLAPRYTENNVQIVATIQADFDMDGQVNIADLITWAQHFGRPNSAFADGDANQDGRVNIADLINWAQHFGRSANDYPRTLSVNVGAVAIPEPNTLGLFALLSLAIAGRPRRRLA